MHPRWIFEVISFYQMLAIQRLTPIFPERRSKDLSIDQTVSILYPTRQVSVIGRRLKVFSRNVSNLKVVWVARTWINVSFIPSSTKNKKTATWTSSSSVSWTLDKISSAYCLAWPSFSAHFCLISEGMVLFRVVSKLNAWLLGWISRASISKSYRAPVMGFNASNLSKRDDTNRWRKTQDHWIWETQPKPWTMDRNIVYFG